MDITQHIKSKSDQLNADDLIGGPIVVQVERVTKGNADQPVIVHISGGHCPYKPNKTALRILAATWGKHTEEWTGVRWLELYRDPLAKWQGKAVGGVMVSGLSHIVQDVTLSLTETRGKKRLHKVRALKAPKQSGAATANLGQLMEDAGLTTEDVDRWLVSKGKGSLAESGPDDVARLAGWLAGHPEAIEEMKGGVEV